MAKSTKAAPVKEADNTINAYELMLILSPDLRESEIKKKLKELVDMIEKAGGRVTKEDFWGRRNMTYRIKKYHEGIYMVYNLELPNAFLKELKDHLRIEKDVLRSMTLKLPSDYEYTKYDLDAEPENLKERHERPSKKNVSIKHNAPVTPSKKKEEVKEVKNDKKEEEVKEEKKAPAKEKKEVDESELDKKLDAIIGGEDLNL